MKRTPIFTIQIVKTKVELLIKTRKLQGNSKTRVKLTKPYLTNKIH